MKSEMEFLGVLDTLLKRSDLAYKAYFESGKKFLYARILKDCNDRMRTILVENAHRLPATQAENALALLHHIDVWSSIWEDTVEEERPTALSAFSFESLVGFPRTQVRGLMDYYEQIQSTAS